MQTKFAVVLDYVTALPNGAEKVEWGRWWTMSYMPKQSMRCQVFM